jgi:GR25 family glycosyltransferase involved in LPS biosynthesis
MKAFVINLERRTDRLNYMKNILKTNLLNIEIIKAYDGTFEENNSEEYEKLKNFFLECIKNNLNKNIHYNYSSFCPFKKGELGCFISHLYIWKRIIDEKIDKSFIFEDDCILNKNFELVLGKLLLELPDNFNVIWLGGKTCDNYSSNKNVKISNLLSILKEEHPYSTCSYMISYEGALFLYDCVCNIFRGKLGVDYFMFDFFNKNNYVQHTLTNHIVYSQLGNNDELSITYVQF